MITVKIDKESLVFDDLINMDVPPYFIYFYAISYLDPDGQCKKRLKFYSSGTKSGYVDDILEIITEPYRTALLFNLDLLDKICRPLS